MSDIKLSIVIPSYRDPLLLRTIADMLEHSELGDQLEIIAVLDGYWQDVTDDPRVRVLHLGRNSGMRRAICAGIAISQGEFIMRSDEHIAYSQGFDKLLTDACQDNWIMTGRRYALNPKTWKIMPEIAPIDYEKLVIQGGVKFCGFHWDSRAKKRADILIDETMAMQGSMWLMPRSWWDKVIVELDSEHYGPHYQDSHEMVFKTWKAGGKLMVHKGVWYAHKHYSFPRTHNEGSPENPANREASWKYCMDTWMDYYQTEIRPKWKV